MPHPNHRCNKECSHSIIYSKLNLAQVAEYKDQCRSQRHINPFGVHASSTASYRGNSLKHEAHTVFRIAFIISVLHLRGASIAACHKTLRVPQLHDNLPTNKHTYVPASPSKDLAKCWFKKVWPISHSAQPDFCCVPTSNPDIGSLLKLHHCFWTTWLSSNRAQSPILPVADSISFLILPLLPAGVGLQQVSAYSIVR